MITGEVLTVRGYELRADRSYDPATHLWVELRNSGAARVGFDPLGRETCGDIVQLSFQSPGAHVVRGEAFGNVEAAKFVGPLIAPVSGAITAVNQEVLGNPGLVNDDPGVHWLVELAASEPRELEELLMGEEHVAGWFADEVERFRSRGAIAE